MSADYVAVKSGILQKCEGSIEFHFLSSLVQRGCSSWNGCLDETGKPRVHCFEDVMERYEVDIAVSSLTESAGVMVLWSKGLLLKNQSLLQ